MVGYNRKQVKSTAFWGPRRTPISAKIKKKIIKEKRIKNKQKRLEEGAESSPMSATSTEEIRSTGYDSELTGELSYKETVNVVKRSIKLKRQARQRKRLDTHTTDTVVDQSNLGTNSRQDSYGPIATCSNNGDSSSFTDSDDDPQIDATSRSIIPSIDGYG